MSFSTLLYIYLLGGFTFVPLVLAVVLIPAWLSLPKVEDGGGSKAKDGAKKDQVDDKTRENLLAEHEEKYDGAASGTFAVLRSYDFQAANTALNARSSSNTGQGGVGASDGTVESGNNSESVYQSMYRSVFDRSKTATPSASVLQNDDASSSMNGRVRKRVTPANVFYIVLRHGHLMLYDSAAQMEVRHVISLAHYSISLSEGAPAGNDEKNMRDGDLFIKRTAVVLNPTELPSGQLQPPTVAARPFYLFSSTCIEKEDFYHALLYTRTRPPIPEPIEPNDAIKLQSTLHSTSMTQETRALNALVGRIFLALHHTEDMETLVRNKVETKISRVQKPAYIASLALESIDLGDAAPVISNPRLRDLNISGDMTIAFDVRYTGGVKLRFSALAKLDLGPRFKTRTAGLVLASSLQRLQGHMLVRIKPPPSNRIWFCFESMPDMDIKVEPVVSQRQITYAFILRAIEERIRAVVGETMVKPNWDDVSFFDTARQVVRGGIWKDGGPAEPTAGEQLSARNEKTRSMPALHAGIDADSSATSSGTETPPNVAATSSAVARETTAADLKRRSVDSLPARASTATVPSPVNEREALAARPLRSPSFASPSTSSPSIALDQSPANFDPIRADDAQSQQSTGWRVRTSAQGVKKDAIETMREMRDRSLADRETSDGVAEDDSVTADLTDDIVDKNLNEPGILRRPLTASTTSFTNRSMRSTDRTDTNLSTSTTRSNASQQRKNILAATAAATTAARNWSWNAISNRSIRGSPILRSGTTSSTTPQVPQEPVGRGQPLPPPGMPLPGPQQSRGGFFTGTRAGIGSGSGSVRRKPVPPLPPRWRTDVEERGHVTREIEKAGEVGNADAGRDEVGTPASEFGPWRENSGVGLVAEEDVEKNFGGDGLGGGGRSEDEGVLPPDEAPSGEHTKEPATKPKVPPPLPARPRPAPSQAESLVDTPPALEQDNTERAEQPEEDNTVSEYSHIPSALPDSEDEIVVGSADEPLTATELETEQSAANARRMDDEGYGNESEVQQDGMRKNVAESDDSSLISAPKKLDEFEQDDGAEPRDEDEKVKRMPETLANGMVDEGGQDKLKDLEPQHLDEDAESVPSRIR